MLNLKNKLDKEDLASSSRTDNTNPKIKCHNSEC